MCQSTTCSTCGGVTWLGCGSHVPAVLDSVPEAQRCDCGPPIEREGKMYPPGGSFGGMIKSMFGFGGKRGNGEGEGKGEGKGEL